MRLKELAAVRVGYGYRRLQILLRREGWQVNAKRVYRLYCEEKLSLRTKTPRRRVSCRKRVDRPVATRINDCWAMDFMADECESNKKALPLSAGLFVVDQRELRISFEESFCQLLRTSDRESVTQS